MNILQKYVKQIVLEKIRSQYNYGTKFNWNMFKDIQDMDNMIPYADAFLEEAGTGSSRTTYIYSAKKILKIAMNQKGIAQNEQEKIISDDPSTKDIVARVHYADPEYRFIISDLVNPLSTNEDLKRFEIITGISFGDMENKVEKLKRQKNAGVEIDRSDRKNKFIEDVLNMMEKYNLLPADVLMVDHWGFTPDGRIVFLDYGATEEVFNKYYK